MLLLKRRTVCPGYAAHIKHLSLTQLARPPLATLMEERNYNLEI
jgi:hypothetical protein